MSESLCFHPDGEADYRTEPATVVIGTCRRCGKDTEFEYSAEAGSYPSSPLLAAARDLYIGLVLEHGHDEQYEAVWPACRLMHATMSRYRAALTPQPKDEPTPEEVDFEGIYDWPDEAANPPNPPTDASDLKAGAALRELIAATDKSPTLEIYFDPSEAQWVAEAFYGDARATGSTLTEACAALTRELRK